MARRARIAGPSTRKAPHRRKTANKRASPREEEAAKVKAQRNVAALRGALPLDAGPAANVIDQITNLAAASRIAQYKWLDLSNKRDKAPLAYIKGMAVMYARVYCKLKASDVAATIMARKKGNDPNVDVLTFYDRHFANAGLDNSSDGSNTLRHLFVLMVGLVIQESSGRYCAGRYYRQGFKEPDSAEAGLFQASYNMRVNARAVLENMFEHYIANPTTGFREIFEVGIQCKTVDWQNWGDPTARGYKWQDLTKKCPAFAAEFAGVGLRTHRLTWGQAITEHHVEIVPDCDTLFRDVEPLMESAPGLCAQVV
jgi:hypothetical protein